MDNAILNKEKDLLLDAQKMLSNLHRGSPPHLKYIYDYLMTRLLPLRFNQIEAEQMADVVHIKRIEIDLTNPLGITEDQLVLLTKTKQRKIRKLQREARAQPIEPECRRRAGWNNLEDESLLNEFLSLYGASKAVERDTEIATRLNKEHHEGEDVRTHKTVYARLHGLGLLKMAKDEGTLA